MRPVPSGKPIQTDGDGLADTRVRFLTAEPVEPGRVRAHPRLVVAIP